MDALVEAIKNRNAILFVGAGVSKNLGLPLFEELVSQMGVELDFDPELFRRMGSSSVLAEYYRLEKGTLGKLRSWMDRTWHDSKIDISKSDVHKYIVQLYFPIIYTTNYDRWLERAFEFYKCKYHKILNVADIAKIQNNITQIVKYHGDFDDDSSIVLTESDYFERFAFEAPLDIKLRADALGKTLLFIGYSLEDVNVRYLLYKLHRQWVESKREDIRPRSYIFMARPNIAQEKIMEERGITPILCEADDPGIGLSEFLSSLIEKISSTTLK